MKLDLVDEVLCRIGVGQLLVVGVYVIEESYQTEYSQLVLSKSRMRLRLINQLISFI